MKPGRYSLGHPIHRDVSRVSSSIPSLRSFLMIKKLLAFFAAMYMAVSFAAVDVNKATAAELDGIKGIGPGISAKIIDERKKGDFKDWNNFIERVKGIGETNAAKFSAEGMTVGGASFKGAAAAPAAAAKKDEKPAAKADEKKADAKPAAAVAAAPAAAAKEEKKAKAEEKMKKAEADKTAKADAKKANDAKPAAKDEKKDEKKDAKAEAAKPAASAAKK
ncbi:MAG TPA: helix-hairpin-helix domain-containing protein [Polaromonas sp.]